MSLLALVDAGLQMTGTVSDLSIPLDFDGPQPNHFGAAPASAEPMQAGAFTGDTRLGGSCNAISVTLNAHCNGTHTECVGHLTSTRVAINDVCPALPMLASLVTVETATVRYNDCNAHAITQDTLEPAVEAVFAQARTLTGATPTALAIRTVPNSADKRFRRYARTADAPFMATEAARWLVAQGVDHVIVDLPSIDPHSDHGRLAAHRILFGLPTHDDCPAPALSDARRAHATITELAFMDDAIADGLYLMNLQIPPFCLDAAPSRPLLYSLETV